MSDTWQEYIEQLDEAKRERFIAKMFPANPASSKYKKFVDEYCIDFNIDRAAKAANVPSSTVKRPNVVMAIHRRLTEMEAVSELRAEYVRDYIKSVMEFCPTDYFLPAPEGGWMVRADTFDGLPYKVKRLIENIELRQIRGMNFMAVTFISKTIALGMAAKYTLTQHLEAKVVHTSYEDLAKALREAHPSTNLDETENRIAALTHTANATPDPDPHPGPTAGSEAPLAEHELLR